MSSGNRHPFGRMPDGTDVELLELRSGPLACHIITYGGALQALTVPDREGRAVDVLLGFDTLEDYLSQDKYLGAIIGRYANRIGGARFALNGKEYRLAANDGANHLHGGARGFDKRVWKVDSLTGNAAALLLVSGDGEEGYPGQLRVRVTYTLTDKALEIEYQARSDRDTLCSLTSHAYFNLSGHQSGPVEGQYIQIPARFYTPTGEGSIPTGEIAPVEGTPMDLRKGRRIGKSIDGDFPQLRLAGGYDHNWVLPGSAGQLRACARAWSVETGIAMDVLTTRPGVQFYSGNYLDGCPAGKGGAPYGKRWGFCLETQAFPDAPNCAHFPSAALRRGESYRSRTIYRFSIS